LRRLIIAAAATGLVAAISITPAQAHAFGVRYDLPLPLWLYLAGAAGAVALSFVIMAVVFRDAPTHVRRLRIDLLRFGPMRILAHPVVTGVLQAISVGLFFLILATGFFGTNDTLGNFAPTFVWIIWWVGFAYVAALVGNLWPVVNPWSIVFAGLEQLAGLFGKQDWLNWGLACPRWLGVWPAVVLFAVFAWLELIYGRAKLPEDLATLILAYSALTWIGMAAFGREQWLARGEAFSLAFGVFGRFAPIGGPDRQSPDRPPHSLYLRPYASDLIVDQPCHVSMTVFVLLLLSTVTFDGFKETPVWTELMQWGALEPALYPVRLAVNDFGFDFLAVLSTIMLLLFPLGFFVVYMAFSDFAKAASGSERPLLDIAGLFVLSLVPIAVAYHLTHYLAYLLISGQLIIPLVSDPFGFGWNLFGTAGYKTDIGVIGARFVWYTAVVTIVAGHVLAVGVAHFVALKTFDTARAALRSQYPVLVLMIGYTVMSLWILSQPIVEAPNYDAFREPSGVLSLTAQDSGEVCIDLAAGEEIDYDFKAGEPAAFSIHYHVGREIQFAVQLNPTTVHTGSFVADIGQNYCLMWSNQTNKINLLTYRVERP
jgi:hypothetical protein